MSSTSIFTPRNCRQTSNASVDRSVRRSRLHKLYHRMAGRCLDFLVLLFSRF